MGYRARLTGLLIAALTAVGCSDSATVEAEPEAARAPAVATDTRPGPKLYVFDCGHIYLDDVAMFGLADTDTSVRELFVPCYLVDHPDGQLLWDAGLPLSMVGRGRFAPPDTAAEIRYDRSVLDQLAELGFSPPDIEFIALSHSHFDHVGAAAAFTGSTLLIQAPEFQAAFIDHAQYPIFDFELYGALSESPRVELNGDHDVFGDGSVIIISTPGHTPGHQSLFVALSNYGPVVLSGDLYHFRASRRLRTTPTFNTDAEETRRSMDKVEALLAERDATLWIEHDNALAQTLNLAPAYYD